MKWITKGFSSFMRGQCGNSGQNLYVSAAGILQRIYQFDVNQDGYPDLLFANSQSMGERPPVYIYKEPLYSSDYYCLPSNGTYDGLFYDLSGDGFDDLILACQNDGAHSDTTAVIYYGNKSGLSEKYKMELPVPDATGVAAGDFNGDGKPDLAFVSCGQTRIFYQTERGFHAPSYIDLQIYAQTMIAADLDHDGFCDLYAKMTDGSTQVFWGGPDGLSADRRTTIQGGKDINRLQATSTPGRKAVDHSWRPTVISIGGQAYLFRADNERIYLYTCDINRNIQLALSLACPNAVAAAAGDYDGDGYDDLAVAVCNNIDETEKSFIFWNSKGFFNIREKTAIATKSAQSLTVIPPGEGSKSYLVVCQGGTSVMRSTESLVYTFSEDRQPAVKARLQSGDAIRIAAGHPDGSSQVQLAVLNHETGRVRGDELVCIYLGGPDGYQADRKIEFPGWAAVDGLMFDANDDGLVDVLVSNCAENAPHLDPGSFLYLQNEEGFDQQRRIVLPTFRSHGCIVGDFRKSGYLDIATGGFHNRMISIYNGGPDGYDLAHPFELVLGPDAEGYRPPAMGSDRIGADASAPSIMTNDDREIYKEFGETRWLFSADFNGDGWLDLFVSQIIGPYCYILWGGPEGFSTERMLRLLADGVASANAADLDGDGYLDLILAGHQSIGKRLEGKYESYITIYWGGADGYKENRKTQLPASCANAVTVGDFNGDGVLDLYATSYHNGRSRDILSYVYYGQQGGIYSTKNRGYLFNHSGSGCVAGDFNGDGYTDLAIACHKKYGNHISESFVFWGSPNGLSDDRKIKLPTVGPHGMSIVDPGNIMDRGDYEYYYSEIFATPQNCQVSTISWDAVVPECCKLELSVRQAYTPEAIPNSNWSEPITQTGQDVTDQQIDQPYIQYRLALKASCGCGTPRVSAVSIEFILKD